ncbi:MAG: hypothetical protein IJT79_03490 [Ruminococcus sp.]|nr:hypothetical protein [Ruminococcus sp.]
MKPFQKVVAALLAVIIVVSMAVSMASCSLAKEWSYKYGDKEYNIGVYIYSLYNAYLSAESYAKDAKGYKEGESFLDLKIKDDDGKTAVARDWIKEKASETARQLVALDKLVKKTGATWDEATMKSAEETVKDAWDMGPYAMYGSNYYNPMSKQLEPYGVSYESFLQIYVSQTGNSPYSIKSSAVFDKFYAKGGSEEVSDKDLAAYFIKNYADYSYIPVKLYESKTGEDGNATNTKFSDKKTKKIKEVLKGYVEDINGGKSDFDDIAKNCEKKYGVTSEEEVKNRVDNLDTLKSQDEEVYKSVKKLENGKAELVIKDESGDAPTAYIIVKNDINNDKKTYVSGDQRTGVLQSMKGDDFKDMMKKEAKDLSKDSKFQQNDGAVNSYNPDMFYEKPEETSSTGSSSDSEES